MIMGPTRARTRTCCARPAKDFLMSCLFRDQLLHKLPAREDENPVGDSLQFDKVSRKQQYRCALCGEFVNDPVDLCFRTNIDTYSWLSSKYRFARVLSHFARTTFC